jgi:hypothetical protein
LSSGAHVFYAGFLLFEPLHRPFFVLGIFEIGSCELFVWAEILLISASQIARIIGVGHQYPDCFYSFVQTIHFAGTHFLFSDFQNPSVHLFPRDSLMTSN